MAGGMPPLQVAAMSMAHTDLYASSNLSAQTLCTPYPFTHVQPSASRSLEGDPQLTSFASSLASTSSGQSANELLPDLLDAILEPNLAF